MVCVGANQRLRSMQVGLVRDFVVVSYTNNNIENLRGRVPQSTLQGEIIFARLRQFNPRPVREANLWVAPEEPSFCLAMRAIPVHDLCSFLHKTPERSGRRGFVNLVTVAVSYVNE